jgi:beta-mannosidase
MPDFRRLPLPQDGWTVRVAGGVGSPLVGDEVIEVPPYAASSIHATLARAGVQRPWQGERAELESMWVGRTAWTFTREVEIPTRSDGAHCALVIETIDGPCEIVLGGLLLGSHNTEHVPFEVRVPDALRGTTAVLELRFRAPVDEVLAWQQKLGARPVNGDWTPFCFARSAACGFGWDWGPQVAGVGFYGARFDCWNEMRVTSVSVAQRWNDDGTATVRVTPFGDFDRARLVCVVREREGSNGQPAARIECNAHGEATLAPVRRWTTWDRGSNEGAWWNAMVGVRDERGTFKLIATTRFALRRVELDTSLDEVGRRFRFILNGEPVFARGANLIPPLLGARHEFDWLSEMRRYRETGFNMVRVWGGGNYLPGAFYEACDELGILVWQDFMFACATYPEDEPFMSLVAREAAHQVARLSRHPSLALWCGGNEDILAWWSWGWKDRLAPNQSWGQKYWLETLPAAVAAHDAGTPYWAESPYSGSMEIHPNDPDHGDRHTWDAEAKIEGYRAILPRFSSEFGHQSPPCWQTILEECLDATRDPDGMTGADLVDALKLRQKAWGGDEFQYKPFLTARFREARSAREYVAQAQHLQARAMDVAMHWLRAGAPRSMGALIWQWNDVWAGHSWSLIDSAGRAKPAWHAVRRACGERRLSIEATGDFANVTVGSTARVSGAWEVVAWDDRVFVDPSISASWERASRKTVVRIDRMNFYGKVIDHCRLELVPHPQCSLPAATRRARIPVAFLEALDPARDVLVATIEGDSTYERAVHFFGDDATLMLPDPWETSLFEPVVGQRGVLRAVAVVREFWIEQHWQHVVLGLRDRDDEDAEHRAQLESASVAASWRTLLPGDEVSFPEDSALVWWSANHFVKSRSVT